MKKASDHCQRAKSSVHPTECSVRQKQIAEARGSLNRQKKMASNSSFLSSSETQGQIARQGKCKRAKENGDEEKQKAYI